MPSKRLLKNSTPSWLILIHTAWIVIVMALGTWWGTLVIRQSKVIADLQSQLGINTETIRDQLIKTQRMVYSESTVFLAILLVLTFFLYWLYRRETARARSIQAFFAGITHELKTPLTSIRLQAEAIAETFQKSDEGNHNLVRRLLEDTLRMEAQVERTLELARLEGDGNVFTQPMHLKTLIERNLVSWTEAHGKNLRLHFEHTGNSQILADELSVQMIIRNIVDNAIKHSKAGALRITFDCKSTDQDPWVELTIQDNGMGYPGNPNDLGNLFLKGRESQGAGVGLYLIGSLMKNMKGKAKFNNMSGGGFCVTLLFPKAN